MLRRALSLIYYNIISIDLFITFYIDGSYYMIKYSNQIETLYVHLYVIKDLDLMYYSYFKIIKHVGFDSIIYLLINMDESYIIFS